MTSLNVNQSTIARVKDYFNLNIYETKVWLALLQKGVASAGEIADISGVPRSRTYDVLESLEKRGFAVQKIGKPVKYLAVKPMSVLDKLKKNAVTEMDEKIKTLSNIKDTSEYRELELLHSTQIELIKKQDLSGTITGKSNINSHINDILNNSENEIIICTTVEDFKKKQKMLEPFIKKSQKSKFKFMIVLKGDDSEISEISKKLNIKAKKIDLDGSFFISDKSQIVFMLNNADNSHEQTAVWFSSPFFVKSFTGLFDIVLKK